MKTIGIDMMLSEATKFVKKNSPAILTGIGISGVVTTVVMAVRATPEAEERIEAAEEEKDAPLTKTEIVKAAWRCYIPTVSIAGLTVACFVGAQSINTRRNVALATLYTMTNDTFKEYREAVVEKIGETKEEDVQNIISRKKLEKDPLESSEVIITDGTTLCYDSWSGRYFKSSIEKIRGAVNDINNDINRSLYADLNDFYFAIGLPTVKMGDYVGWNADRPLSVYFSSQIAENDTPCIVLNFHTEPLASFMEL